MYKIGAFAKLCQVSVQTLRYYEQLDLIEPEYIDPFTNYRYYTLRQIEQVNRIVALKELGFSLEQIRDLIFENITTRQIGMMLKFKQAEIQRSVESELERLRHINFHIRLLEQENKMIDIDMTIKAIEETRILSYKGTFANDQEARALFAKATIAIKDAHIPLKHDYVMVLNEHEYESRLEDLEIAFPVVDDYEGDITVDEGITFTTRTVAAQDKALTLMHKGVFEGENGMSATVKLAFMWMAQNGYEPLSPVRINYLAMGEEVAPEDQLRQIQIPVKKIKT